MTMLINWRLGPELSWPEEHLRTLLEGTIPEFENAIGSADYDIKTEETWLIG